MVLLLLLIFVTFAPLFYDLKKIWQLQFWFEISNLFKEEWTTCKNPSKRKAIYSHQSGWQKRWLVCNGLYWQKALRQLCVTPFCAKNDKDLTPTELTIVDETIQELKLTTVITKKQFCFCSWNFVVLQKSRFTKPRHVSNIQKSEKA